MNNELVSREREAVNGKTVTAAIIPLTACAVEDGVCDEKA